MSQNSKLWHCDIWKRHQMSHSFKSWYKGTFTFYVWIGLGTALTPGFSLYKSGGFRNGLTLISSQFPVSVLGEWRHICHFFRWQKTFLGRMWRSRTRKHLFKLVTFFVTSFPKNVTFWPRRYKKKFNRKKCDDSAETETCFILPVSDLSLISEAWSGKAIWSKTDP